MVRLLTSIVTLSISPTLVVLLVLIALLLLRVVLSVVQVMFVDAAMVTHSSQAAVDLPLAQKVLIAGAITEQVDWSF